MTPLVDFGLRQPVGVGDVTSGLLLVKLLRAPACVASASPPRCAGSVIDHQKRSVRYELQVAACRICIAVPEHCFSATRL